MGTRFGGRCTGPGMSTSTNTTAATTPSRRLSSRHVEVFEESAIPEVEALAFGCWSVERVEDLPDDLAGYGDLAIPGFVVPLRDVHGNVHHQVRIDPEVVKARGGPKALQPKGVGSIITVPAPMADRAGTARKILITEGTRQTLAATLYAPDDVLVVGLQGCQNWTWSSEPDEPGVPHPDLGLLGINGAEAVVCFDTDVASNPDVWTAAKRLGNHLGNLGAKRVAFIRLDLSKTDGLDDYLGKSFVGAEARKIALASLIAGAGTSLGRKPASKLRSVRRGEVRCDSARGLTVAPPLDDSGVEREVAEFAGRVVRVTIIKDDDDPTRIVPAQLEVELAFPAADGVATKVVSISDDCLDIDHLLAAYGEGVAVTVGRPTGSAAAQEVINAIRVNRRDETVFDKGRRRLGWVLDDAGDWRYLHAGGALGAELDNSEELRAVMPSRYRCIDFSEAADYVSEEYADATRASVDAVGLLADPTPWYALLGAIGIAPSGLTVPATAIGLVGEQSAGKSGLLQTATAFLSPEFSYGEKVMSTADATANSIDLALNGHDHSFMLLDDFHPESDPREQSRQAKALDAALRRSHGAPGRGRGEWSRSTGVQQAATNNSHPVMLMSLEEIPPVAKSGIDRMLTIEVTKKSTFLPDAFDAFKQPGNDGSYQIAYAGYISWLAKRIAEGPTNLAGWLRWRGSKAWPSAPEDRMREWRYLISVSIEDFAKEAGEALPSSTTRARRVVGALSYGLGLWLEWAVACGAIDSPRAREVHDEGWRRLIAELRRHTDVAMGGNIDAAHETLEAILSVISSGRATIEDTPGLNVPRIGKVTKITGADGEELLVLALNARVRIPDVPANWPKRLRPLELLADDGRHHRVRINSVRTSCVVIRHDLTGLSADSSQDL